MRFPSRLFAALLAIAGASAWFVVSTVTMDEIPDPAIVAVAAIAALVFVSAFSGTPIRTRLANASRPDSASAFVGGALAWGGAPLIVLLARATDAPSGSESLFFTTAGWAIAGVVVACAVRRERPGPLHIAGALFATLGAAALLASWERPSSFSPFVKFPVQEIEMLAAGVVFAVGSLALLQASRRLGPRTALWLGIAGAALLGIVATTTTGIGDLGTYQRIWPQLTLLGAALASLSTGWLGVLSSDGLVRSASLLFIPPVAVATLFGLERVTGVYGVNPIIWPAALAGAAIVVAGVSVLWVVPRPGKRADEALSERRATAPFAGTNPLLLKVGAACALAASLAGAVSLALPAFASSVDGLLSNGEVFRASWTMAGAESAAGWLPLLVGLLALSAAWNGLTGPAREAPLTPVLVGLIGVAAYPVLVSTPLATWNRWIPADVQQAYGTEYARLVMYPVSDPIRLVALALACAACLAIALSTGRAIMHRATTHTESKETT